MDLHFLLIKWSLTHYVLWLQHVSWSLVFVGRWGLDHPESGHEALSPLQTFMPFFSFPWCAQAARSGSAFDSVPPAAFAWHSSLLTFAGTCLLCRWSRTWLKAGWRVMTPAQLSWSHTSYNVSSIGFLWKSRWKQHRDLIDGGNHVHAPTQRTVRTSLCHFCYWLECLEEKGHS